MTRAAFDDLPFVAQAFFGLNELAMQLIEIATTDIAQLHTLEVIPNAFIGIEIRSITGKLFEMQAFSCPSAAESL